MVRGILADTASVTNVTKPIHSYLAAGTRRYSRYTRCDVVSHAILTNFIKKYIAAGNPPHRRPRDSGDPVNYDPTKPNHAAHDLKNHVEAIGVIVFSTSVALLLAGTCFLFIY